MSVTLAIVVGLGFVNAAVHFNNQRMSMAIKVRNISINDLLPAEMQTIQLIRS